MKITTKHIIVVGMIMTSIFIMSLWVFYINNSFFLGRFQKVDVRSEVIRFREGYLVIVYCKNWGPGFANVTNVAISKEGGASGFQERKNLTDFWNMAKFNGGPIRTLSIVEEQEGVIVLIFPDFNGRAFQPNEKYWVWIHVADGTDYPAAFTSPSE